VPKIPDQLVIGAHTYEVRSDPDTAWHLRENGSRAETRADRTLILIDPDLPPSLLAESLLHEILHACWHQTPLRVMEHLQDQEEEVVTALAPILLAALRSSKPLQRILAGD
jgi:hypothetical protein